jgi:DNA-directed RNA polymerase specialized sigma24 family protein
MMWMTGPPEIDPALVRAAQRGDPIAVASLMDALAPYVGRVCGPIALHDGPDAAQEALIAILKNLRSLRDPSALYGWARAIAVREAVRVAAKSARAVPAELTDLPAPGDPQLAADVRDVLTREAIRLTRTMHELLPDDGEVTGLLALMLITDSRRPARTGADGSLVPLAEQDRELWDRGSVDEGTAMISQALARTRLGPYQLQAAIAAVHAEAARAQDTDWPQIAALYELAEALDPNPVVTLNHAVAAGMAHGPQAGLALLAPLETDPRLSRHHRLHAVRAHLLEMAGNHRAAHASYQTAARLTTSVPEQNYLQRCATRLAQPPAMP